MEGDIIYFPCLGSLQKCQAFYLLRSEFVILLESYFNAFCKCNDFVLGTIFSLIFSTFCLLLTVPMINNLLWLDFQSWNKSIKCVASLKSKTKCKTWSIKFWLESYDILNVLIFRNMTCYNDLFGRQQPY